MGSPRSSSASIDVDVPYANPAPPPTTSGAVDYFTFKLWLLRIIAILAGSVLYIGLIFHFYIHKSARFQLESVSVSVDSRANITGVWKVGFSIDKSVGDLDVWIRFLSRDFKAESVGIAGHATVSLTTPLPRGFHFPDGLITVDQVMFKCNNYKRNILQAVCKDLNLGFSSNETTKGVMQGGPRMCPKVQLD